jgi:hypothetical protein
MYIHKYLFKEKIKKHYLFNASLFVLLNGGSNIYAGDYVKYWDSVTSPVKITKSVVSDNDSIYSINSSYGSGNTLYKYNGNEWITLKDECEKNLHKVFWIHIQNIITLKNNEILCFYSFYWDGAPTRTESPGGHIGNFVAKFDSSGKFLYEVDISICNDYHYEEYDVFTQRINSNYIGVYIQAASEEESGYLVLDNDANIVSKYTYSTSIEAIEMFTIKDRAFVYTSKKIYELLETDIQEKETLTDNILKIISTRDGGYIILTKNYAIKRNESDDLVWTINVDEINARWYNLSDIMELSNGNIILVGPKRYEIGSDCGGLAIYNKNGEKIEEDSTYVYFEKISGISDNYIVVYGGETLHRIEHVFNLNTSFELVDIAESSPTLDNINDARIAVNEMAESIEKDQLQARLNALVVSDLTLVPEKNTSNMDIYVSSGNSLSLSLVNSSITFDDFSGTEDLTMSNALSFTVNSSVNYNASISLVGDIVSSKGNIMDKSIFNLRASGNSTYSNFVSSNTLNLFINQSTGNNITHKVDMMLKGNVAHTADVYKAVLKVEVGQV